MLIGACIALVFPAIASGAPLQVRTLLTFVLWPVFSIGAAIWALVNVLRYRSIQFVGELAIALTFLWLYYQSVFLAPV